jgi:hypothetical protein
VQWTLTLHTERSQETGGQRQLSSRKVQGTATERSMCTPHTHWLVTVLQVMTRSHMAHSSQVGPRPTQQKSTPDIHSHLHGSRSSHTTKGMLRRSTGTG